jgi:probable HAF family extracellular repeat protein
MTELGNLPGGSDSFARAITAHGQIVGEGRTPEGTLRAIVWQDRDIIDLQTLPTDVSSRAWDVNNDGDIVGASMNESFQMTAVLWTRHRK